MDRGTILPPVPPWAHAAAIICIALVTLFVARGLWGWTYDDAYIIYRYARNFADGLGMVYNPGQHYLGTSSAGYTLLLALLVKILPGIELTVLGSVVSAVCFIVSGALFWLIGVDTRKPVVGLLAAVLALANPLLVESWGGEMPLLLAVVLGAVFAYSRLIATGGRSRSLEALAGALLALALLTRQDSIVLLGLLGAHYLWVRRRLPIAGGLAFVLVMLPWVVYSWLFFGSPLPGTLEAKIAQGQAGLPYFLSRSLQTISEILGNGPAKVVLFVLLALGLLALAYSLFRRERVLPWLLLLGWAGLFTAGYTALRVSFYHWYAVPMCVGGAVVAAWGIGGIASGAGWLLKRVLRSRRQRSQTAIVKGAGWGIALLVVLPLAYRLYEYKDLFAGAAWQGNHDLYSQAGQWLKEHASPGSSAAYEEIGEIGYYSDVGIVDMLGLITPGMAAHVPYWDFSWGVLKYRPDYYLAEPQFELLVRNITLEPWFQAAYTKVTTLSDSSGLQMTIYKRSPSANLPAPMRPVLIQRTSQQPTWVSPGAAPATWPGQSFTSPYANLSALALLIGKPKRIVTGTLVLHLRSDPASTQDLRAVQAPVADITNDSWYTFRFEPLPDSAGKGYFLTVELTGMQPTSPPPLALWYATDDLLRDGTRYEGSKPVVGDLCLRAWVPDSSP